MFKKNIDIKAVNYPCKILDVSGANIYRALAQYFLDNSNIIVLVYDITDKSSFLDLEFWLDRVIEKLGKKVYFIL